MIGAQTMSAIQVAFEFVEAPDSRRETIALADIQTTATEPSQMRIRTRLGSIKLFSIQINAQTVRHGPLVSNVAKRSCRHPNNRLRSGAPSNSVVFI